jgi:hypothetical protein
MSGSCECGNKHSGFINFGAFLDCVSVAFQEGHCSTGWVVCWLVSWLVGWFSWLVGWLFGWFS